MSDLALYEIANELKEKNKIEKEKLEFDKDCFVKREQTEKESVEAMKKMTEIVNEYANAMKTVNKNFEIVCNNIVMLREEIHELKTKIESV